jgi:hypothetical protein
VKLCTHVLGCTNKEHLAGLCQRHYRNRHLEASSATASAATATNKRARTKARNGRKKAKTRKPVVLNENGKTEGETDVD